MDDDISLSRLEEVADKLGIPVRYEKLEGDLWGKGGLCRIEGRHAIIIPSQASRKEKIQLLIQILRQFDLGNIYIKPAIRELLNASEV